MSDLGEERTKNAVTFFLVNYIRGNFLWVTTNAPTINPVEIITGKLIGKKTTELEKKRQQNGGEAPYIGWPNDFRWAADNSFPIKFELISN